MADMTGIVTRHGKDCRSRTPNGRCNCQPTFEPWVFDKRSGKKLRPEGVAPFKTPAAARGWRVHALDALQRGTLRPTTSITLREAAAAYIEGMRSGAILDRKGEVYKPSVIKGYEASLSSRGHEKPPRELNARGQKVTRKSFVRTSILDDLGALKLSTIERRDVQAVVERMRAAGCSASTIRNAVKPLQVIYRRAIENDEITVNPTIGLKLPKVTDKQKRVPELVEVVALIAALREKDQPLWALLFYAGLRLGEAQALDIADIDFAADQIIVSRSWDYKARSFVEVKNRKPRRVPMSAPLRTILLAHLARKMADGTRSGLAFGQTPEIPFVGNTITRRALTDWKNAKLQAVTPHVCRHAYVTLMHAATCSLETIGDYVGHSSTYMTNHYRHLLEGERKQDVARFDAYFASQTGGAS